MYLKPLLFGSGWYPYKSNGLDKYFYEFLYYLNSKRIHSHGIVNTEASLKNQKYASKEIKTIKVINEFKPNIVSIHFYNIVDKYLGLMSNMPKVVHFHTPWAYELLLNNKKHLFKDTYAKETNIYNKADKIITLSQSFKDILIDKYNVDESKIIVIPGGADTRVFNLPISKEEARIKLGYPLDRKIILVVRRLIKRTGIDNLIKAINIVKKHHPDVLVLIAGEGTQKDYLANLINRLDLNKNIKFIGYVPQKTLPTVYKASDFTVVPSIDYEGFGISVIESLASGSPVLVTPIGGLPEIITPFSKDLVLENIRVSSLISKLNDILEDKIILPSSKDCINYSLNYDWSTIGPKIINLYQALL